MSLRWWRQYVSWCSDPKVQLLEEYEQRRHVMLLGMQAQGDLEKATEQHICFFLRITPDEWKKTKKKFLLRGLIADNGDGCISIPAWEKRQGKHDISTPRVQLWRKQHTCVKCGMEHRSVQNTDQGQTIHCPNNCHEK